MQSSQFKISGLLQPTFPGSTTTQLLETYSRSEQTKPFGDHQDLPPTRGVGYLDRFQRRLPEISHPRSGIRVQGPAIRFVHSTHGVHCDTKGGETDGHTQGFKNPPVPRRLVGESQIPPGLPLTYTGTSKMCQQLGRLVNLEKSELEPKQDFVSLGYLFDLRSGWVRLTPDRWQNLLEKRLKLLSLPACPVWEFMSLIVY